MLPWNMASWGAIVRLISMRVLTATPRPVPPLSQEAGMKTYDELVIERDLAALLAQARAAVAGGATVVLMQGDRELCRVSPPGVEPTAAWAQILDWPVPGRR
jgi:hypothetical protein